MMIYQDSSAKRILLLLSALLLMLVCESHIAQADDQDAVIKVAAKRVEGDAKTSRKVYKKHLNQGRKLMQAKKFEEAVVAYQEALSHDPNNAQVLGELGFTAQKMGQYKLAQKMAELCIRQSQSDQVKGSCYYNLGRAFESQQDKEGAARAYADSLRVRPGNKTVKKRLDQLNIQPKIAKTSACLGEECKALEWREVCPLLIKKADKYISITPGQDEVSCEEVGSRQVSEALLRGVSLIKVSGGEGEEIYFIAFKVEAGWVPAGVVGYCYNPGVFGVYEDIALKMVFRDVIGADQASELIVHTTVDRRDSDLGIEEEEYGTVVLEHVCELKSEGLQARCYGPLLISRAYTREHMPDLNPKIKRNPDLPINERYQASISYPTPGQVKVVKRKGSFEAATPIHGAHSIDALPKTSIDIYTR